MYLLSSVWGSAAIIVSEKVEILPLPGLARPTVLDLLYGDNGYVKLCAGVEEGDFKESFQKSRLHLMLTLSGLLPSGVVTTAPPPRARRPWRRWPSADPGFHGPCRPGSTPAAFGARASSFAGGPIRKATRSNLFSPSVILAPMGCLPYHFREWNRQCSQLYSRRR